MLGIAFVLLWVLIWSPSAHAECVVDTDSPTFVDGKRIERSVIECDTYAPHSPSGSR